MRSATRILVFIALCLIWSSTWLMIKIGLRDAPPITSAGWRFFLAALIIFAIVRRFRIRLPRSRAFFWLTLYLGVFQLAVPYALVYWAEQHLTAGLTAVLFSTMPIMVAILARVFLGDRLTASKLFGIGCGVAGVYFIFSDSVSAGGSAGAYGVLAALGSAFLASLSSVIVKKYSHDYPPFATISIPHLYGAVLCLLAGAVIEKESPLGWEPMTYVTVAYLTVFGSVVAFSLYFWIIKHIDITVLSYQTFVIPVFAVFLGWIFLKETVTIHTAIGGSLVLAGIALAVLPGSRRRFARAGS
jgi:drug/metabolite transporter (DMT)-like permease